MYGFDFLRLVVNSRHERFYLWLDRLDVVDAINIDICCDRYGTVDVDRCVRVATSFRTAGARITPHRPSRLGCEFPGAARKFTRSGDSTIRRSFRVCGVADPETPNGDAYARLAHTWRVESFWGQNPGNSEVIVDGELWPPMRHVARRLTVRSALAHCQGAPILAEESNARRTDSTRVSRIVCDQLPSTCAVMVTTP
jgi:hypothetical protein